jgi:ligand-binding SRPBCC domain-containing protein
VRRERSGERQPWEARIDDGDVDLSRHQDGNGDAQRDGLGRALWVHHYSFAPHPAGTRIRDRVEYALPAPYVTAPAHTVFVRPMIERIVAYRRDVIARVRG